MNDQDVRDMLHRRAADARVSPDALDQIQARINGATPATRRHWPTVIVAVAAILAVALVTVGLVGRDDDPTSVEVGPSATTAEPTASSVGLLDAVWPSADENELRGISADHLRHQEPWPAARAYIGARLDTDVAEEDFVLVSGDATAAVLRTVHDAHDYEISLKRLGTTDDPLWYVVRSDSRSVAVRMAAYDGDRITGEVVPQVDGDLTIEVEPADASDPVISVPVGEVERGDPVSFDEQLPDEGGVVVRAVLRYEHRTAMTEAMVPSAAADAPVAEPAVPDHDPVEPLLGIYPWPEYEVPPDTVDMTDPVQLAEYYVYNRIAGEYADTLETRPSAFREGDANSGEVEISGDVETTVLLRRDGDEWYVEAAVDDAIGTEVRDDGTVLVRVADAGTLVHSYHSPSVWRELRRDELPAGGVIEVSAPRGDEVGVHVFVLLRDGGPIALVELRAVETSFRATEVPDDAVDPSGGLEPREVARDYLRRRLGEEVEVRDFVGDGESGTVDWSGGGVRLRLHDGYWYVTAARSDLVSLDEIEVREGELSYRVSFANGASITVSVHDAKGGDCGGTETTNNHDGGEYRSTVATTCDPETVRALYQENDTGVLAIAEVAV